jgi:FkbM family methyltransferase
MRPLQLANSILARAGFRLNRVARGDSTQTSQFYQPPATCQIPELATLYRLYFGEKRDGLFVEVGAYDGLTYSNSSCLAEAGWRGFLIEPIPQFAKACRERYRGHDRVQVVETAVGATNSSVEITIGDSLTTTDARLLEQFKKLDWAKNAFEEATRRTVPLQTLDHILEEARLTSPIDVLIVDVEGAEAAVFEGFSLQRWMPRMIISELSHTHPDLHAVSAGDANLQRSIEAHGYEVVYKDSINTVFVSSLSPANYAVH